MPAPDPDPGDRARTGGLVEFDVERFGWADVAASAYKPADGSTARGMDFTGVSRHTLAAPEELPAAWELRYFEFEPGGYSSLEKHRHAHFVVVLRGCGRVLVGAQVVICRPFDAVYVPSLAPHRWMAAGEEPFGFLCTVDRDRDRPQPLADDEWAELRANPETSPFIF
ncbi:MAG TPA: cupin domain-containing protein [Solirubrobacteraceae bacterium]